MGRRSVGELPVFDYLIVLTLGSVVGADIAEPQINHIHTAFAIVVIGLLQKLYSELSIRSTRFRKLTKFDPVVVVKDGQLAVNNLRRIQYSIDNVLELLRENGVFNIADVELALIEANGQISIYKKPEKLPVTPQQMGLGQPKSEVAYPVIVEGRIHHQVLSELKLDATWLNDQLKRQGYNSLDKIFFASVDAANQLQVTTKQ